MRWHFRHVHWLSSSFRQAVALSSTIRHFQQSFSAMLMWLNWASQQHKVGSGFKACDRVKVALWLNASVSKASVGVIVKGRGKLIKPCVYLLYRRLSVPLFAFSLPTLSFLFSFSFSFFPPLRPTTGAVLTLAPVPLAIRVSDVSNEDASSWGHRQCLCAYSW